MRLHLTVLPALAIFLGSCAYEGVVVQKDVQPYPMYLSQGMEGKYAFVLEDKAGVRHRQLVTPEVFERYALGQYFNDQETGPSGTIDEGKAMKDSVMTAHRTPASPARYVSKSSTQKTVAAAKSSKKTKRVADKAKARRNSVAAAKRKRSKPTKAAVTVAQVTQVAPTRPIVEVAPPAAPMQSDYGVVTVARCR